MISRYDLGKYISGEGAAGEPQGFTAISNALSPCKLAPVDND